jgi:hypothetical protein
MMNKLQQMLRPAALLAAVLGLLALPHLLALPPPFPQWIDYREGLLRPLF